MDPLLYIGRAAEQVEEFIAAEIDPILEKEKDSPGEDVKLDV